MSTSKHSTMPTPDHKSQSQYEKWTQYLYRRCMHLLLRHDPHLFKRQFHVFYSQSTQPQHHLLQFYDRYLKLQQLSTHLLKDILPHLHTQLSLQTQSISVQEEAPTRGEVDWPLTITQHLPTMPDQPPLRFSTRQRQQHTATTANLLVTAILLHYQKTLDSVLTYDQNENILTRQEHLYVQEAAEQIQRELTTPYTQKLKADARQADIETLIAQVRPQLSHGSNSAYRNLIDWWEEFDTLHIGTTLSNRQLTLTQRHLKDALDSWLYDIWLVLELLDLLHTSQQLLPEKLLIARDCIQFDFRWQEKHFSFRYNRQSIATNTPAPDWQNRPTFTPHFSIARANPLIVGPAAAPIWQEPPVPIATTYTIPARQHESHQSAFQQLLGGMQLATAQHGILLGPYAPSTSERILSPETLASQNQSYREHKLQHSTIHHYQLIPDGSKNLPVQLHTMLQTIIDLLPERQEPSCQGVMLDTDTINASRTHLPTYNVLCPKPHIGPGVFDLVNDKLHCLKDPTLCHIFGQAKIPPFAIHVETLQELATQNDDLRTRSDALLSEAERTGNDIQAEQIRQHIFLAIGRTVEQYVTKHAPQTHLEEHYKDWIFADYWDQHPDGLNSDTRKMLLSAAYVWDVSKEANLEDWAAPAVQYCRALEAEVKRRLHDHYPHSQKGGFNVPYNSMTLGSLKFIYEKKDTDRQAGRNWELCMKLVHAAHIDKKQFEEQFKLLTTMGIAEKRNKLAHGDHIPRSFAQTLRETIIGHRKQQGILPWLVEHLPPKH